jgi:hypothetical protein
MSDNNIPPPLAATSAPWSARQMLAMVLSICLGLFLADAFVSLADDSLMVLFNLHLLAGIRLMVVLLAMLLGLVVYVLMALTPMVPKRLFLPVTLFNPAAPFLCIPFMIYCFGRLPWVAWGFSLFQVVLGLWILFRVQGGWKLRWPLVPVERLGARGFSWLNLCVFVLANLLILLPATGVYLVLCTAAAVSHFSDGFMALHPSGITVQMRKYVRDDGKTVELFPMSHVADSSFYRAISQTFPTNSIILMEGVTDENHLLTNGISYKRMANALGLAEQHETFAPERGEKVRADVDVSIFSTNTLALLKLVMQIHAQGLKPDTLQKLLLYPAPPDLMEEVQNDLLGKRNQHLLDELKARLAQTDFIVVPWGVAHMPGIAEKIQREGFHLTGTHDYMVIRFHRSSVN